jgi:uncharacterized protein (DUF362 family)
MKDISRRDFIKYCGLGTIGLFIKPTMFCAKTREDELLRSEVIQCFHENATTGSTINESIVQIMMDESIKTLTGVTDVGEAWKSIFPGITENSVISIKVNCINGSLPTHPQFVNCIIDGLTQMQFGSQYFIRNNIIIWDRTDGELSSRGYTIYTGNDPDTVRCFGTSHSGIGYDYSTPFNVDDVTSYPSRILTEMTDFLINTAVLKDHNGAQVTLTMKNHYGSVDNPGSLHSTGYTCNPDIPALNQQIRDVITPNNIQKIFIVDGLFGRVNWGPGGSPNCNPKKLLMSFDTVACDYQGQNLINEERLALGYGTVSAPHIPTAAAPPYNLGSTDVDLIEINNPTGISEYTTSTPSKHMLKVAPNPARTKTTITFSMPKASAVNIDLINASGRIEDRIFAGDLSPGQHRIVYEIKKRLPSGSYFVRLQNNDANALRKLAVLN